MEMRLEHRAVVLAIRRYERLGWTVTDVSRQGDQNAGYDLFLERDEESKKVEVKGAQRSTEFPICMAQRSILREWNLLPTKYASSM